MFGYGDFILWLLNSVQKTCMLQEEINRVKSENKKLTETLARVCQKYYALNNLLEEFQSRKSLENVNFQKEQLTGKRKQGRDDFVSSPNGLSCGTIENITSDKATVSTAYFHADKSDTSLVSIYQLVIGFRLNIAFECID